MTYPEYQYSELVMGGVKMRNNVLSAAEFRKQFNNNKAGCYRNHFKFSEDFQKYTRANGGSVSGYKGACYVDFFWIDIDNADLAAALDAAQMYIGRLAHEYEIPPEHLRCFFSGKKGFHIGIPAEVFGLTPSTEIPAICKGIAISLASDLDIDMSLYERIKLLRLNNTQHEDSKLYKIELEPKEILNCADVQEIRDLAVAPRSLDREYYPEDSYGLLTHLLQDLPEQDDTFEKVVTAPKAKEEKGQDWMRRLLEDGPDNGRVNAVKRLTGAFKNNGLSEAVILAMLRAWDEAKNSPTLQNEEPGELERTVKNIYAMPGDGSEETPPPVAADGIVFQNYETIFPKASAYVEKFSRNRIKFGFPTIDKYSALLGKGEVAIILAYVAVGKTVLAQNIAITALKEQGIKSVMFSLEMSAMRLYFRQLAIFHNKSPQQIEQIFMNGDGDSLANENKGCEGLYIVDHVPVSVPLMRDLLDNHAPEGIDLVIVDYVGLLHDDGQDNYQKMNNLSRDLAIMAKQLEVAVIAVYQTNRTGANGEINLGMGRDSGMIEANCDIALGFWADETDEKMRHLRLLKARHGRSGVSERVGFVGESPKLFTFDREEQK